MPFGFGRHDRDAEPDAVVGTTVNALVTATEEPIDNVDGRSKFSDAQTQVLVSLPGGPVVGVRGLPLDPEHWLVDGMTVPVSIDPANPNAFEVDWAHVPPIEDRVAANDPTLLDPMTARLKNWEALAAAGFHEPDMDQVAPQSLAVEMNAMRAELAAEPESFARQLNGLAGVDAPEGYRRALVQIATTTATWEGTLFGTNQHRERHGKHAVVLSVSLPGAGPYLVFVKSFDHEHRAYDEYNPGLPALVSTTDPTDVQVQWNEMAAVGSAAPPPPAAVAGPGQTNETQASAAPASGIPADYQASVVAKANEILKTLAPAARPAFINAYRRVGIILDDPQ